MYCKRYRIVILAVFFGLILTACGNRAGIDTLENIGEIGIERNIEAGSEIASKEKLEIAETAECIDDTSLVSEEADRTKVTIIHTTEEITYSDEETHIQYTDDLSLLDQMGQTDFYYAYRDGKVYYRQYHKGSFVEGAESTYYYPAAGTDKEIVCIDVDGGKTVLFSDKGYGNIYLIGERFYMTELITRKEDDIEETYSNIYSVDMQGKNRVDIGFGEIMAVDQDRNILVLTLFSEYTGEGAYFVLDGMSGEMTLLTYNPRGSLCLCGYHDGWCYFDEHWDQNLCRVVAMSIKGEHRLVAELESEDIQAGYGFGEDIRQMEIDGEWIGIVFGAYDHPGGRYFQGGKFITIKTDGSGYQAIESNSDDCFLCHDAGRPYMYFENCAEIGFTGKTCVWDLETNTIFPSDFPTELIPAAKQIYNNPYIDQEKPERGILCERDGDVYALLVDHGMIIKVAERIDDDIVQRGDGEACEIAYDHLYYADGYLYFEVTFSVRDKEFATRWGDGYRRLGTDMYRRKLDDGTMELLNSY